MKNCVYVALLFTMTSMAACQSDKPVPANSAEAATMPDSASGEAPVFGTQGAAIPPVTMPDAGMVAVPTVQPIQPSSTAAGAASGKLNPAHGQPGHRCEIAVGAPLDSKPTPKVTATPSQQKVVALPTPTAAPTSAPATAVAPGMNPAHGQPGHRCDIAVGAPLDSKPAAKQNR